MKKRMYRTNPVRDVRKLIPLDPPRRDYGTPILTLIALGILFGFLLWWAYGCGSSSDALPTKGNEYITITSIFGGDPLTVGPYGGLAECRDHLGSILYTHKYQCHLTGNPNDCAPVLAADGTPLPGLSGPDGIPSADCMTGPTVGFLNQWVYWTYPDSGGVVQHGGWTMLDGQQCEAARQAAEHNGENVSGGNTWNPIKCEFVGVGVGASS